MTQIGDNIANAEILVSTVKPVMREHLIVSVPT